MQDCTEGNKKRVREDDSDINNPEAKVTRVTTDSHISTVLTQPNNIPENLLTILDDSDSVAVTDTDSASQELDSVIKSFQDEIVAPVGSESQQAELGFLLEASDDQLGLPPSAAGEGGRRMVAGDSECRFGEVLGFEVEDGVLPSYDDSFEFGFGFDESEYAPLGGLFDFGGEESLPAL